jgi:hypothetical protein
VALCPTNGKYSQNIRGVEMAVEEFFLEDR